MAMPKSAKLQKEDANAQMAFYNRSEEPIQREALDLDKLPPIKCFNEFVAILPIYHTSTVLIPGQGLKSDEGHIVGVGEKVTSVNVGDVVKYSVKHATPLEFNSGPYKDLKVVIITVQSIYCKVDA
jgi:hypothetical protein